MAALAASLGCAHGAMSYPESRRVDAAEELHGVRVADPYRWLEDGKSQEVRAWMAAQDQLARQELVELPRREELKARLAALSYLESRGVPVSRGGRLFFARRAAGAEKAVVLVSEGGQERALLDPFAFAADGTATLGTWVPNHQGTLVAYALHLNNSDEAVLRLREVATGKDLDDRIEGANYAEPSWTPEGDGFYYVWLPTDKSITEADRPGRQEVRFHKLGAPAAQDTVVREAIGDARESYGPRLSKDGRWLLNDVQHGWTANDVWLRDARTPGAPWVQVVAGRASHYDAAVYRDRLYLRTDEGAPRGRVLVADCAHPERAGWKELIPEHPTDALDFVNVVGGKLALHYLHDVTTRLEVRGLDGTLVREEKLPGLGTASGLLGDEDQDEAYYQFTSLFVPTQTFRTSIATGRTEPHFAVSAPVEPARYLLEQRFFASKDGTRIPLFVARKQGTPQDGTARALLTGYGGFNVSNQPTFSPRAVAWMDQGGVWALANLRGGGEYGEEWHRAGMLERKQNVFDDFTAAAQHLFALRFTKSSLLAIEGGSNGGLLVGAAETQHPELFGAVICGVPLLDMIRYDRSGAGRTWVSEYGSAEDSNQFKSLYAYSPYHHVTDGTRYPPTLFLSSDSDDRVDPMHARKMAAVLQTATTGGPVLLRIEQHAGHGGADLVKAQVEESADALAFALEYLR